MTELPPDGSDPGPVDEVPGFRRVPRTGVIYVMSRAQRLGYGTDGKDWINLGQGSPELGPLPGAPRRPEALQLRVDELAYGPVDGLPDLRAAVAEFYNHFYRRGLPSKYTAENVCIAPGGRAAMARVAAALGPANLGHFIPDYTAYEELLGTFRGFIPIPILVDPGSRRRATEQELEEEILGRGLSAVLCSNPCNPTGQVVSGDRLRAWVDVGRRNACSLIFDEFYSHYVYSGASAPVDGEPRMVSAARYVEDVDRDPVVLVDGLTKNWRLPGLRISWIVGPRPVIEQVTSAGSFLDGGANHPFQEEAVPLLDPSHVLAETRAIQAVFAEKRRLLLSGLAELGVVVDQEPEGAFYVWGNLENLPEALSDGTKFFEAALSERVITVPGVFFDVNPGQRRVNARYGSYTRFSFGPESSRIEEGLGRIRRLIDETS